MWKETELDWDYWNAQLDGYNELKKKKKLWRDHKNENKEIVDRIYEWFWGEEE
tara:strand:+ start:1240 stop:1398 length:159 start_codon:yes stop_codon:yes gene_type:complete